MLNNQRGVTMLGWLLLLIPVGAIVYAGIRVTPIYLNYFHVVRAREQSTRWMYARRWKSASTLIT